MRKQIGRKKIEKNIEKTINVKNWGDRPDDFTGIAIDKDGNKVWLLNGELHREDGPAIERAEGTKSWWLNGKRHREDGPAAEWADGSKFWWLNGKRHREDGPSHEFANGSKLWRLNNKHYTEDEYKKEMVIRNSSLGKLILADGYFKMEENN